MTAAEALLEKKSEVSTEAIQMPDFSKRAAPVVKRDEITVSFDLSRMFDGDTEVKTVVAESEDGKSRYLKLFCNLNSDDVISKKFIFKYIESQVDVFRNHKIPFPASNECIRYLYMLMDDIEKMKGFDTFTK